MLEGLFQGFFLFGWSVWVHVMNKPARLAML